MADSKCKKCRRAGEKLFLKGDKCFTAKCPFVERPYAPGKLDSERKHRSGFSEYGVQMKEKQKLRNMYGVSEKQFSNYVENVNKVAKINNVTPQNALLISLESRLDNFVYRMGIGASRALSRQLVNHGHIVVNNRRVSIPSYSVKVGDVVAVREGSKNIKVFTVLADKLKDIKTPKWLEFDPKTMSAKTNSAPSDFETSIDVQKVLEFYSR
jgi:small subunit ribosomal protein S4